MTMSATFLWESFIWDLEAIKLIQMWIVEGLFLAGSGPTSTVRCRPYQVSAFAAHHKKAMRKISSRRIRVLTMTTLQFQVHRCLK